jgi:hypothetical protein
MFTILKFALLTCAFYLGLAVLVEASLFVLLMRGGVLYAVNFKAWGVMFGVFWLIAFAAAWRVMMVPYLATFPRPR